MTETQEPLYAAVELAYSEAHWAEALSLGQQLLGQLDPAANPSLSVRLELLLGHTQLYGFGNASAAAEHYTTVQQARPEPILLDIAQQGLEHCQVLLSSTAAAEPVLDGTEHVDVVPGGAVQGTSDAEQERGEAEGPQTAATGSAAALGVAAADAAGAAFPFTPTAVGNSGVETPASAMPWMVDLGGSDPGAQPAADGAGAVSMASNPFLQASAVMPASAAAGSLALAPTGPAGIAVPDSQADREQAAAAPIPSGPIAVEVVDEPELIEVHQADPARAEEIEVVPIEANGTPTLTLEKAQAQEDPMAPPLFTPEEEEELGRGLLRVVLR
ncbi:hypothetical protein [Synechococcus sp. CS-1328]|uniref:hypothetical protein n=1 Tax=Synechococcus sp. CS-1328 TaxID=2847976 RepID=UPI00223B26A0|nr:hypothetical protein [Synechococcus sp. CS-1328]MCT0224956.1 hypothetical protein [Synechococcus sp. CS-1328]